MQTIKHFKNQPNKLKLNNITYRGYSICDIPANFGCILFGEEQKAGIDSWFNYKGLTWIAE